MTFWRRIPEWLGITSPAWVHNAVAARNMPIIAIGSVMVGLFSAMLAFCLLTGAPCPVDGFDGSAHESPQIAMRYTVTAVVATVLCALIYVFATLYTRRKWKRPGIAAAVTALFAFLVAMLWGIAESGLSPEKQTLIFASVQFLVAGLIVFDPIVSLIYFAVTFFMFGSALEMSGQLGEGVVGDLAYLALLDVIVCWVVYGLFYKATQRQREIADMSRRDELTGAKNRHYLRDDFTNSIGTEVFVMLCDVDDFKHYNDNYGHDVGDYLLKQFYFALREAFGDECSYRYGGDEFLIVSEEFGDDEFKRKLAKVKDQLAMVKVEGADAKLTYSGGYVHGLAADNESFRAMLHVADENLMKAKQLGKDRVVG